MLKIVIVWQRIAIDAYLTTLVRNLPQNQASAPILAVASAVLLR
jgi:hypothetical protein